MRLRKTLLAGAILALGLNSQANAQQCTPCPPGQWSQGGTETTCTDCGPNQFCPGWGAAREPCPAGLTTGGFTRATSRADCSNPLGNIRCNAGHYATASGCFVCAVGTVQNMDNHQHTSCNPCPVGQYQNQTGQRTCIACASGFSTLSTGSSAVSQCRRNYAGMTAVAASRLDDDPWVRPICNSINTMTNGLATCTGSGNAVRAGCFVDVLTTTPTLTRPSYHTPSGGIYCYCQARNIFGTLSSWGYIASFNNANDCRSTCPNRCFTIDFYFAGNIPIGSACNAWGCRTSW